MTGMTEEPQTIVTTQPTITAEEFEALSDEDQEEIIDRYVARLESQFPAEEITRAFIEQTVGELYPGEVDFDDDESLRRAIEFLGEELPRDATLISSEDQDSIERRIMDLEEKADLHTVINPIWTHRQFIPYSLAIIMMILALRFSSLSLAIAGGALLIVASLHYADRS